MMTASKDYGVRVLMAYENKRVGQVIFPYGVERQLLLQRGIVESVAPAEQSDAPPATRAPKGKRA